MTDAASPAYQLLVVSNRLPDLRTALAPDMRRKNVGGLVAAVEPALQARHGIWLGWSGQRCGEGPPGPHGLQAEGRPALAWVDFLDSWHRHYYNGLCNSALWPLFHSFPGRLQLSHKDWASYREVNAVFAEVAGRLIQPGCPVWIHDYHLLLLGRELRARGHAGPLGLFLHIPFPGPDIFSLFPWAEEVLEALLQLDLIGFHTRSYAENFRVCATRLLGARDLGDAVEHRGRRLRVGVFPIGIIPESYQEPVDAAVADEVAALTRAIAPSRLVLGVDRLDYTKGIPERLMAFGRFLKRYPEWRGKVSLVQISVPSREEVPEYAEQRARVENIVGRVNGEFGEAHWVPIRYLYRSYGRAHLSELYRAADVGYVTALRDGMNLVAKEYVAAQDPARPGVLLLSKFAGAAEEMTEALLTNPWDLDGMAEDLDRALRMGEEERRRRHAALLQKVERTTALSWAEDFLGALGSCRPQGG